MWISISNIIFYITCFKGCITSKGDLAMEYFGYNGTLCKFKWITKWLRFVDQVVMEWWYRSPIFDSA